MIVNGNAANICVSYLACNVKSVDPVLIFRFNCIFLQASSDISGAHSLLQVKNWITLINNLINLPHPSNSDFKVYFKKYEF